MASIIVEYTKPTTGAVMTATVNVTVVTERALTSSSVGEDWYLRCSGGGMTPWMRKINDHILDALEGKEGKATAVTALPSASTDRDSYWGAVPQLERPATATGVTASATGTAIRVGTCTYSWSAVGTMYTGTGTPAAGSWTGNGVDDDAIIVTIVTGATIGQGVPTYKVSVNGYYIDDGGSPKEYSISSTAQFILGASVTYPNGEYPEQAGLGTVVVGENMPQFAFVGGNQVLNVGDQFSFNCIQANSTSSAEVTWTASSDTVVEGYYVYYEDQANTGTYVLCDECAKGSALTGTSAVIGGTTVLTPGESYKFYVTSTDDADESNILHYSESARSGGSTAVTII